MHETKKTPFFLPRASGKFTTRQGVQERGISDMHSNSFRKCLSVNSPPDKEFKKKEQRSTYLVIQYFQPP